MECSWYSLPTILYDIVFCILGIAYTLTPYSVITMQGMAAKLNFTQGDIEDYRIKIALEFAEMEVQ